MAENAASADPRGGARRGLPHSAFRSALQRDYESDKRLIALVIALIAIWLVFHVASGGLFLTLRNFYNLVVQSSTVAILAVGMVW